MRHAQEILMIETLAQPVIHMTTVSMETHTTQSADHAMVAKVTTVTEHSK
jgi:hypothetical protein